MRNILILLFCILTTLTYAQETFTVNDKGIMSINPKIVELLHHQNKPIIKKKIEIIKQSKILDKEHITSLDDYTKDLEFIQDTIQLNTFLETFEKKYSSDAHTTLGMNSMTNYRFEQYEMLINKYYNKALDILNPKLKIELETSQKLWKTFNDNDNKLIYTLTSNNGTMSYIYSSKWIIQNLLDRLYFLRDIYVGKFYKEDNY